MCYSKATIISCCPILIGIWFHMYDAEHSIKHGDVKISAVNLLVELAFKHDGE